MGPISLGYFILFYFANLHTILIRDNVFLVNAYLIKEDGNVLFCGHVIFGV